MFLEIPLSLLCAAWGFAFLAGLVKGITGFAMPMVMVSSLGSFLSPELALAGLILPTLITNLWQAIRRGWPAALSSARKHWRYLLISLIFLLMSAQMVAHIPPTYLFFALGLVITAFAILQLSGWRPCVTARHHRKVELGIGAFAGVTGGLSGVWGPPTVLYLTALNVPKPEHIRVQGVVYSCGAVMLFLAHLNSGILDETGFKFSALLLLPALLGMAGGMAIQDKLDQDRFRLAILIVLIFAGLNLMRRGLFG